MRRLLFALGVLVVVAGGAAGAAFYFPSFLSSSKSNVAAVAAVYKTPEERDVYVRFVMEGYDVIRRNYWQKATDKDLANLFHLSIDKAAATTTPEVSDRVGVAEQLSGVFKVQGGEEAKRQLATMILQVALYNIAPTGRNQLLSTQAQQALQQTVANVTPGSDLYKELGVSGSSTKEQIQTAYAKKESDLAASSSPDAKKALERAEYVRDTLTSATAKERYDSTKAEPTVFRHVFGSTLYLNVARMSPQTADDFLAALRAASTTPLSSLIIDLRGNIGGSLEQVPNMLGGFFGANQYLFDLYHQGTLEPIRSPIEKLLELSKYKEIALLTDTQTQSSAEVMTATLKRFHLATVVGAHTRGWGTVEKTYPLETQVDPNTKYALLLVWGLTLRDDNQQIDEKGVDADISIDQKGWEARLPQYFRSASLISAIKQTVSKPPLK